MNDELKDQRVVTMMSPSELDVIDDWSFKNRIRSRGEAIRRLCQMGLLLDSEIDPLSEDFYAAYMGLQDQMTRLANRFATAQNEGLSASEVKGLLHKLKAPSAHFDRAYVRVATLNGGTHPMRQTASIDTALSESQVIAKDFASIGDLISKLTEKSDDSDR